MRYHFLSCVTPPQWFHKSGRYTVLFSVCGKKAREETKTVNPLSKKKKKKKPRKMERRRPAKANVSRSVVFGRRAEGESDLPLRLSLSPPPLSCLTSSTVFISSFPLLRPLWTRGRQRPLAAGSPVQRRCEPSNRLSLPSGTSNHFLLQLKAAMSCLLASVNHSHINFDTLV